jgi:hypothetical protein
MQKKTDNVLAACGLYCGACYHYRASFYDRERLVEAAAQRGRVPEGFTCRGCRSAKLYVHPGCAQCEIRACANRRGAAHCGVCPAFPCERIRAFQSNGRVHHENVLTELENLREQGAEAWLVEQAERWTCACGEPYSWYETTCHACGRALQSYGSDPTLR